MIQITLFVINSIYSITNFDIQIIISHYIYARTSTLSINAMTFICITNRFTSASRYQSYVFTGNFNRTTFATASYNSVFTYSNIDICIFTIDSNAATSIRSTTVNTMTSASYIQAFFNIDSKMGSSSIFVGRILCINSTSFRTIYGNLISGNFHITINGNTIACSVNVQFFNINSTTVAQRTI